MLRIYVFLLLGMMGFYGVFFLILQATIKNSNTSTPYENTRYDYLPGTKVIQGEYKQEERLISTLVIMCSASNTYYQRHARVMRTWGKHVPNLLTVVGALPTG
eukprot:GHVR01171467.1.p1 GENE.GHVR01171467.1~~GHVR01171467.1.p1  ORF type:complete len:103 (-),score=14.75 GHVR01171467.1:184-492(-)